MTISVLHVHRSGARAGWFERIGSEEAQYRLSACEDADGWGPKGGCLGETRGFLKMLLDAHSDRILGFTAFSDEASEMTAAVQTVMLGGMPSTALRDAIFRHPTTTEGLMYLLASVQAKSLQQAA